MLGRWDIVLVYFVLVFFNIAGEELWWRGYILPRQELTYAGWTWVVHGVLWAVFHFFKWWDILNILPITLGIAYVYQRRQNSTPGFIIHDIGNGTGAIGLVGTVMGLA